MTPEAPPTDTDDTEGEFIKLQRPSPRLVPPRPSLAEIFARNQPLQQIERRYQHYLGTVDTTEYEEGTDSEARIIRAAWVLTGVIIAPEETDLARTILTTSIHRIPTNHKPTTLTRLIEVCILKATIVIGEDKDPLPTQVLAALLDVPMDALINPFPGTPQALRVQQRIAEVFSIRIETPPAA